MLIKSETMTTNLTFFFLFIFLTLIQSVYTQRYVGDSCIINFNKQRGICKLITECNSAKEDFEKYNVRPTRCGFSGSTVIVCCGQTQPTPTRVSNNNYNANQSSRLRLSERKCEKYSSSVTSIVSALPLLIDADPIKNVVDNCEYGITELIVGGQPVKVGEFPHMAAIGWEIVGGRGYEWNCGGSLISENFVMTAGHCLYVDNTEYANNGEPTIVRLGEFDLTSRDDDVNVQDITIQTIIPHTDYKLPHKYDDIALLKLAKPAVLGKFVRPACLWSKPNLEDTKAIATGWGLTSEGGQKSAVLQRVTLDIMSQLLCSRTYQIKRNLKKGIINSQFCAGVLGGGKDTCQGDSGGPLQIQSKSNHCIFYVIGVTSFGRKCGEAGSGGVYTKISSYIDWIEKTVWPNEN